MNIKLENIGIIKKSQIKLDGLTVITGENNSGKTTVGKVIYSLIDSVSNIQIKQTNDKKLFIRKELQKIELTLRLILIIWEEYEHQFAEEPVISKLFMTDYMEELNFLEIEDYAYKLYDELKKIDFKQKYRDIKHLSSGISNLDSKKMERSEFHSNEALETLKELFSVLKNDKGLSNYTRESIDYTLNTEFDKQIQPVSRTVDLSKIELSKEDSIYFKIEIVDNKIVHSDTPIFTSSPYKRAYFIDDPFVLDSSIGKKDISYRMNLVDRTLLNTTRLTTHSNKLRSVLKSRSEVTIFEKLILKGSLTKINQLIEDVIPGNFEFNSNVASYIQDGKKMSITNLATGSKMFSILKILLEKGKIDETTMLILDEPEAHLHPRWQNKFAEIIILLIKELNVNILLTTHSPNFVLAIDAYMRKYEISEKTNFYQTKYLEENVVEYNCVNDDMDKIYEDFLKYLYDVKFLRDSYLSVYGEKS